MDGQQPHDATTGTTGSPTRRAVIGGLGGVSLAMLFAGLRGQSVAQDATPAAPMLTMQLMGAGETEMAPGLDLSLRRITIVPGGSMPPHSHPGCLVFLIESGSSRYIPLNGTNLLTRAVTDGTPAVTESMPIGTEVMLYPGDSVFVEEPWDEAYNDGDEDLVILFAGLLRHGEPFASPLTDMEMDMVGTPAP